MIKMAVLLSGKGTNFQAIAKNIKQGVIKGAEISVVITNKPSCEGIQKAKQMEIATWSLGKKDLLEFKAPNQTNQSPKLEEGHIEQGFTLDQAIESILDHYQIDLVILAGYMRVLSPKIVNKYQNKIINIHPSLLPSFPGLRAIERACQAGVKITGCTVHFVDQDVDTGPIILQRAVYLNGNETLEEVEEKIHQEEYIAFTKAIQLYVSNQIKVERKKVILPSDYFIT